MNRHRYYLAIQVVLPENYQNDSRFRADLSLLSQRGFNGVELNIREPDRINPDSLKTFLNEFDLEMSMFASGATAKAFGLSLAATDEAVRKRSVEQCIAFLEFAAEFNAGVIAGYLKGPLHHNSDAHRQYLMQSIAEIAPHAERYRTPFLVEAINRFESPMGHSLDDTYELIKPCKNEYVWVLPDTWHMNIEETNVDGAIVRNFGRYRSFHLSDNNRLFPGFGELNFKKIIGLLDALGYDGKLAIEGNVTGTFQASVNHAMNTLDPILAREEVVSAP